MNKTRADARDFANILKASDIASCSKLQLFVIPPFPYIAEVADILRDSNVKVGAQNMHWENQGAWTGEVSPLMLKDCGATMVELGHSERRSYFNETDETVALKTKAALEHGLIALVCIGDSHEEYEHGLTELVLEKQVRALLKYVPANVNQKIIIAYEPVWSIGEGGTPASPEFANQQHKKIAKLVLEITGTPVSILYGGSVNKSNCVDLAKQSHIDGIFIGRAAWNASDYIDIVNLVLESAGV